MKFSFIEIARGWGGQEFGFGHVEVPNGLPNGHVVRIDERMNLNSGLGAGPTREICKLGRPSPKE